MADIIFTASYNGHPVRLVPAKTGIRFVVRDVCDILGYSNPNRILTRLGNTRREYSRIKTHGGTQNVRLVDVWEILELLTVSRASGVTAFWNWFDAVIAPFIRKTCGCCR